MNRSSGISNTAPSGSAAANALLSAEVVAGVLTVGDNSIVHGVTGTISNIEIKDKNNRKPDFSDFRWDATKIYIYTSVQLELITFVISYTA